MEKQLKHVASEIRRITSEWEEKLIALTEEAVITRTNRQGRNIKQLIGHLVDSASNNHQRLVRLQYSANPVFPDYTFENDVWISVQHYQHEDWSELVQLWKYYNLHLAHIISRTDQGWLNNEWTDGSNDPVSLNDIIFNYMAHLTLHLNEIEQLICLQTQPDL